MIHWPAAGKVSKVTAEILERFKKTSAVKELEQDPREWTLVSWPWMPDAPYPTLFRNAEGDERFCVMEADGRWQMKVMPGHVLQV